MTPLWEQKRDEIEEIRERVLTHYAALTPNQQVGFVAGLAVSLAKALPATYRRRWLENLRGRDSAKSAVDKPTE